MSQYTDLSRRGSSRCSDNTGTHHGAIAAGCCYLNPESRSSDPRDLTTTSVLTSLPGIRACSTHSLPENHCCIIRTIQVLLSNSELLPGADDVVNSLS